MLGVTSDQVTGPDNSQNTDHHFMEMAARVSARGLGRVAPNPSVGCVLVGPDQSVLAIARTDDGGRPHAESQALEQIGPRAQGATAYVTLEPCAHEGATPSCARLLIAAGVRRVVIAHQDPDPRTAGRGVALLQENGVEVAFCENSRAAHVLAGYLSRQSLGRPAVTLKIAVSANGFMRTPDGQSPQITGEMARHWVHGLRARHDALVTGSGTVIADDPQLTCRLPAMRSPDCFVLDRRGRFPAGCALDRAGVTVVSTEPRDYKMARSETFEALEAHQKTAENLPKGLAEDESDVLMLLRHLAAQGYNRVMVEAGPAVSRSFWRAGLVDQLAVLQAPHALAVSGDADIDHIGVAPLMQGRGDGCFVRSDCSLGGDQLTIWRRLAHDTGSAELKM